MVRESSLGAALVPPLSPVLSDADFAGPPFGPKSLPSDPPKSCRRDCIVAGAAADDHSTDFPSIARRRAAKEQNMMRATGAARNSTRRKTVDNLQKRSRAPSPVSHFRLSRIARLSIN